MVRVKKSQNLFQFLLILHETIDIEDVSQILSMCGIRRQGTLDGIPGIRRDCHV